MMGRAEVADILMHEGIREPVAWHMVMNLRPEYLDSMDESAVRHDIDNIIWKYVDEIGELDADYAAPV